MGNENLARKVIDGFFEKNKYNERCFGNEGTDYFGTELDYLSTEDTCNGWLRDPRFGVFHAKRFNEHEYVLRKYLGQYVYFREKEDDSEDSLQFEMSRILLRCAYIVAKEGNLVQLMEKECKSIGDDTIQDFRFLSQRDINDIKKELNDYVPIEGIGYSRFFDENGEIFVNVVEVMGKND